MVIFLYSSSPAPYEPTIMDAAPGPRRIVLQTPLATPPPGDLDLLRTHFPGTEDSGLHDRDDAFDPEVIARIRAADLILVTGGSPERMMSCTADTPALQALCAARDRGAVFAGCSAGAMIFGAGMPGHEFWEWIPDVVAPHFGGYDIEPWKAAFPSRRIVGIPDGSMAVTTANAAVTAVGLSRLVTIEPSAGKSQAKK